MRIHAHKTTIPTLAVLVALVAGCQREHTTQPVTRPTVETAPPLTDDDIASVFSRPMPEKGTPAAVALSRARAAEQMSPAPPMKPLVVVPVAVVLMPALPFPDAAAVVMRRPNLTPHNVIMMREDSLTLGAFGAALRSLAKEVERGGERPAANYGLKVNGQTLSPFSNFVYKALAQWELDTLRKIPRKTVQGIGAQRAIMIHIGLPDTVKKQ